MVHMGRLGVIQSPIDGPSSPFLGPTLSRGLRVAAINLLEAGMKTRHSWQQKSPDSVGENTTLVYFKFPLGCRTDGEPAVGSVRGLGKDLVAMGAMIDCLEKTFGNNLIATTIAESHILVAIQLDRGDALFSGPTLWESTQRLAADLESNVSTGLPRPHAIALRDDTLLPLLKQIAKACRTGDVSPPILTEESGEHKMPVLDPQVFDQPESSKRKEVTGSFRVTGGCLTKRGGMSLKLDHDALWVDLDSAMEREASAWTLATLQDGVWIDGSVIRLANGNWEFQEGAGIVSRPTLLMDGSAVDVLSK